MSFTKYIAICKVNLRNSLQYFFDFILSNFFIALIIFIFIHLWKAVYSGTDGIIEGFTLNMMIWYLVLTESIVVSPKRLLVEIGDDIQSGNIAQQLNKPYNYVGFQFVSSMGKSMVNFCAIFAVSSITALIFLGGFNVFWLGLPLVAIIVFLALSLHILINIFLGILGFWIEDTKGVLFIYNKIVFVLGGMLVPLDIFPQWLETISRILPFSFIAYHPARLFVNFDWVTAGKIMLVQGSWIIFTIVLIAIVYNVCIRKISVNGG